MLHTSLQLIIMFLLKRSNGASGHSFIIALKRCRKILKTTHGIFWWKCQWNKRVMKIPLITYNYIIRSKENFVRVLFHPPADKLNWIFFFGGWIAWFVINLSSFWSYSKNFKLVHIMKYRISGKWLYKDLPLLGSQCYRG